MVRIFNFRRITLGLIVLAALGLYSLLAPKEQMAPPQMTVPVSVATALAQDVPHYLQGIGTVLPSADVLVTSRVGGALMKLYFTEGDRVREGDVLAQIDPRPFEAALAQARGTLARDEAELANARKDMQRYARLAARDYVARQTYDQQVAGSSLQPHHSACFRAPWSAQRGSRHPHYGQRQHGHCAHHRSDALLRGLSPA